MRLVCPNCEAKYEVPDDAIPETGRDVQCANCGHAWFQMRHKALSAAEAAVAEPVTEAVVETAPEPVPEPVEEATPQPVAETAEETATPELTEAEPPVEKAVEAEPIAAAVAAVVAAATDTDPPKAAAGHAVDDSVLAILREEADREAIARKADARALESQPDLGLDAALSPTQKRAAMLKGEEISNGKSAARRDLLPDVEEINSTLRPSEKPPEELPEVEVPVVVAEKSGGFRSGFLVVMTLAILGMAVYVSAPQLGRAVPSLVEPLNAYVGFVDSMRLKLDGLMKSATVAINGEAG
jgi:predicted Zn finger-like uncharacterized protein